MALKPVGDLSIDALTSRFCYWQGHSDQRYLFSQIALEDIALFEDCILLVALEKQNSAPYMVWLGEISELEAKTCTSLDAGESEHIVFYVHLLAGNMSERQRIMDDLATRCEHQQWRLSA